ncbi:MAG: hypothetical protein KA712_03975 [Myxococcales bacterium]|nr:hypothetical protein [Myxococcales bacterium]
MSPPPFLFVEGIDGSGKSTCARWLAAQLPRTGRYVVTVHVDDFRRPVAWAECADEATAYYDRYYDLARLDDTLARIKGGDAVVEVPRYVEGAPESVFALHVPTASVVVVEGVFTQRLTHARAAALVSIEVDWAIAEARVQARDEARGRTAEDVLHRIHHRYFPAQRRYRQRHEPARRADWVVTMNTQGARLDRRPADKARGFGAVLTRSVSEALAAFCVRGAP